MAVSKKAVPALITLAGREHGKTVSGQGYKQLQSRAKPRGS